MDEENIEKAVKTENSIRAHQEIIHIFHKYDLDIFERVAMLATQMTDGFEQLFDKGQPLESLKNMIDEVADQMYQKVLKKTKKGEIKWKI